MRKHSEQRPEYRDRQGGGGTGSEGKIPSKTRQEALESRAESDNWDREQAGPSRCRKAARVA